MFNQAQHSGHEGINPLQKYPPPSALPSPPLNQQTVHAPPFLVIPTIYWFFKKPRPSP